MPTKLGLCHFGCGLTLLLVVLSFGPTAAQDASTPSAAKSSDAPAPVKAKSAEKSKKKQASAEGSKTAQTKPKAGQFASEADAKAKCKSTVVWVDENHFNHYEGSREYGVKPGAFACEQ